MVTSVSNIAPTIPLQPDGCHVLSSIARVIYGIALSVLTLFLFSCAYDWLSRQWDYVINGPKNLGLPSPLTNPAPLPIPASSGSLLSHIKVKPNTDYTDKRHVEVVSNVLYVDYAAVVAAPEFVLKQVVEKRPIHIAFLKEENNLERQTEENNLERQTLEGAQLTDWGGPSRTFIGYLSASLLSGNVANICIEDGVLSMPEGGDVEPLENLGRFFSYVHARNLDPRLGGSTGSFGTSLNASIGMLLSEKFFTFLHFVATHPSVSNTDIAKMFYADNTGVMNMIRYLEAPTSFSRDEVTALTETLFCEEHELTEVIQEELNRLLQPKLHAANALLKGFSPELRTILLSGAKNLQVALEGKLDANSVIGCFRCDSYNPVIQEKFQFLKELIQEKLTAGDTKWVTNLLIATTGCPTITNGLNIQFTANLHGDKIHAMTCTRTLDVPDVHKPFYTQDNPDPFQDPNGPAISDKERFCLQLELFMDPSIPTQRTGTHF